MDELYTLLNHIGNIVWLCYALSWLIIYWMSRGLASKNSNLISMTIVLVFNTLMLGYQGILDWYMAENPGISPIVNFCWYTGFAVFYLTAMKAIFTFHKKENVSIGKLGQYASIAFFSAGSLQLLQYSEIIFFKTDENIDKLYTIGIPTINIAMAFICIFFAVKSALAKYSKEPLEE